MPSGRIATYNAVKQRGVIIPDDGGDAVEFYVPEARSDEAAASRLEGQRVEYELTADQTATICLDELKASKPAG